MANSGEQCSVVAKIVGDEGDDYDDDGDFDNDDLQSDKVRIVSASISSKVFESDPCDKGRHKCHGNDEAVVPAMDTSTNITSVLDCLRRPTASELARKQKVDRKPPKGKKRCRDTFVSNQKSITLQQEVKQFNNECFSVSNNKLFCLACQEELSVKAV